MGKWKPTYKVVTKRVLLVTDSHGRELHHLLERSSQYAVTAIVSPNGTLNYITDNALLYQDTYDEVIVMAGTNDINDQGYEEILFRLPCIVQCKPECYFKKYKFCKLHKIVTKRVLLVTDSHGRELHHLLERSSQYSVTAIVSPNGTLNYIADNALLYQETYDEVIVMAGTNDINDQVTKRVLLVTDSHGRELHHLLERSSQYAVTAIVSPNGTLNYIADNALLYQESYDEVIVMAGTNDINDQGYINNDFFNALGKLIKLSKLNNLSIINLPRRRDTVSPAVHRARASLNATLKNINCANFIDNFKL
ncbi:hypothetical protein J6590_064911 [Homalodisca vitripennis]|nr:hypothetical protein J6590_064911 [Homalodisca vitripennis]